MTPFLAPLMAAVDVGTRSARAGLFDVRGRMLARAAAPLDLAETLDARGAPRGSYRFDDLCAAAGTALRAAIADAGCARDDVAGLAFDATCSLVLRARDGEPVALDHRTTEFGTHDTIAWFDHRAQGEAAICTSTADPYLKHLGGSMSPEMQVPKLMWLKAQRPDLWDRLGWAGDLADALAGWATGNWRDRSACTLGAKWPWVPTAGGWQDGFLAKVGLADLRDRAALPDRPVSVGARLGELTPGAAAVLGLRPGTAVAIGLVDAYAAALGNHGIDGLAGPEDPRLALVAGTSTCAMLTGPDALFSPGLWGPFRDVTLPGFWVTEGGQTAAGALLDHVLTLFPATTDETRLGHPEVQALVRQRLAQDGPDYAAELHVLPDFAGNRSPLADPSARGVVSGLSLDRGAEGLAALYWRAAVGLALGLRQVVAQLDRTGTPPRTASLAGGFARSPLLVQLLADALDRPLLVPTGIDPVLAGTAMAAAAACGAHPDLAKAAIAMAGEARRVMPDPGASRALARDQAVFLRMQAHRAEIAALAREG